MSGETHFSDYRKIVHVDMDAFYASVEQRDFPEYRGKPIAVGGGGKRGVTTTASYEARKYGVKSAMPGYMARALCPHIIFVPPRFEAYKEVSQKIRAVFKEYTDLIEPLSLDEAFLDVTINKTDLRYATDIAHEIKNRIYEETALTCSAGISYCKFLAKIASDLRKPDGVSIIKPHQAIAFIEKLEIQKFFGIGKMTARKMQAHGIHTGADLKQFTKLELAQRYGKSGIFYYDIVRGIDDRPVKAMRKRKSIAVERTFSENLSDLEKLIPIMDKICDKFIERLDKAENYGRTITMKIKKADFSNFTRGTTRDYFIKDPKEIKAIAYHLLESNIESMGAIRLIGLSATNLEKGQEEKKGGQLEIDF